MSNENETPLNTDGGGEAATKRNKNINYEIGEWDDPELALNTNILRGVYAYGFEKPSPIQKKGIYPLTYVENNGRRRDIIAQAQSGTGKTGCFVIGMLQNINQTRETKICYNFTPYCTIEIWLVI